MCGGERGGGIGSNTSFGFKFGKITHPKEHAILLRPNQVKIVEFRLKPPGWDCNLHYGKCPGPTKQAEV